MSTELSPPPPAVLPRWLVAWTSQPWWPWAKRIASLAFFSVVAWLVVSQARTIAWGGVWTALRALPWQVVVLASVLSLLTYGVYCSFDLVGRYCAQHGLSTPLVLLVGYISYAFTLNVGTLVGGVAFRWRLYGHFGLNAGAVTHVTLVSMVTNWIGYCSIVGLVFLAWPLELPPSWNLGNDGMRWLGAVALALAFVYVLVCAIRRGRQLDIRGRRILMPGWRVALLQQGLSSLHWSLMAAIIYVLLQQKVEYTAVLATLLVAAMAGVLAHIPAGLGVTEAVFVALLGHRADKSALLAALLAYRAVYYIGPLVIASVAAGIIEFDRRRDARDTESTRQDPGDT